MNQTPSIETLATLASWMGLSPAAAVALPACITSAAKAVDKTEAFIVQTCWTNGELRSYLAGICRKVTS